MSPAGQRERPPGTLGPAGRNRPQRRRRGRGVARWLLALAVLLVVADRVAVVVAERVVAEQVRAAGGLAQRPDVDVRGLPFLTQLAAGRYDDVRLTMSGDLAGTRVDRFTARLRGVEVPLRDALIGQVTGVPVAGVTGTVLLPYDELARQAGGDVEIAPEGDRLRIRGAVRVLGQRVTGEALSSVRVDDGRLVVRAQEFDTGSGLADGVLGDTVGDRFDVTVPADRFPYGLRPTDVAVEPEHLRLDVRSGPVVLQP